MPRDFRRFLRIGLFSALTLSVASFLVISIHWPLVGDSAQIHYICFLMDHGMAPYRITGDMNMPGALILEWLVMHTLGAGSLAWRCFDLLLMAAAAVAMSIIAGKKQRLVGLGAGLLFLLIHGADGLNDTGERDLSIAVALLCALAMLVFTRRYIAEGSQSSPSKTRLALCSMSFGICAGLAVSIKPTALPLVAVLSIVLAWLAIRRTQGVRFAVLLPAGIGFLLVAAFVAVMLMTQEATSAFLHGLLSAVPYYAGLAHKPIGYLLLHGLSPILPATLCWLFLLSFRRTLTFERALLMSGVVFGLASYLLQAKGFPYYRYPLLAFLLPLITLDADAELNTGLAGEPVRWPPVLAACLLIYLAGVLAPLSAWKTAHFKWRDQQFLTSLTTDLTTLEVHDREVQCIDSIEGCGNALLRLRLVQSTGLLSDFFIFGPPTATAVQDARRTYQQQLGASAPVYVIVTDRLHLFAEDTGEWSKINRWPWFGQWLGNNYSLVLTRRPTRRAVWWSRPSMPGAYRLYVRKDKAQEVTMRLASRYRSPTDKPLALPEP